MCSALPEALCGTSESLGGPMAKVHRKIPISVPNLLYGLQVTSANQTLRLSQVVMAALHREREALPKPIPKVKLCTFAV